MKKLRLDFQALRVESFEPAAGPAAYAGTVRANGDTADCEVGIVSQGGTCVDGSCVQTECATCLCPYSGPMPSCLPCSNYICDTLDSTC